MDNEPLRGVRPGSFGSKWLSNGALFKWFLGLVGQHLQSASSHHPAFPDQANFAVTCLPRQGRRRA